MSENSRALVAIAGNPNTGKTTLFNALSGHRAKVGNYPGITVERRLATISLHAADVDRAGRAGRASRVSRASRASRASQVDLVDIPGMYSMLARTAEEQIAFEATTGASEMPKPDVVVVCVDATQLVRSSYLLLQVQEMGLPTIVALTMTDEAGAGAPDISALSSLLGCEVVLVLARKGVGLDSLRAAIARSVAAGSASVSDGASDVSGDSGQMASWRWTPSPQLRQCIDTVRAALPSDWPQTDAAALWALMSIEEGDELAHIPDHLRRAVAQAIASAGDASASAVDAADSGGAATLIDDEVIQARYRWLDDNLAPLTRVRPDRSFTERIDTLLLNRFVGFAVFLAIMFVVFQSLFAWADPAIGLIETLFESLGGIVGDILPEGIVHDFVVDGLIAGVGSVLVFLPQILLLFFFIGLMEDTGYLARVAYLMDRIMKSMNLHGRAFVPMLSGFACAVPAILATRTMERRRDRLLTMMVVPLMTCSARLPVYTLIIAALYPAGHVLGVFPVQGLMMVLMYLFSTATALAAAWLLSRTMKPLRATRLPFVIELPPYRIPKMSDVVRMMWERSRLFLSEAGTVILVCTVVLWALLYFPRTTPSVEHISGQDGPALIDSAHAAEPSGTRAAPATTHDDAALAAEQLRNSYGGRLGRAIEPVIAPLGFDWKIGVGIIGAFAAREVFISTMGLVYSIGSDVDEESASLRKRIQEEAHSDGRLVYTPLVGLSLMIFFALACQCMSTLAVVKRETASYRWPIFLFVYMTALAWLSSFLVYQGGRLLGFS